MDITPNQPAVSQADIPNYKACTHRRITTMPDPLGMGNIRIFCADCGVDVMKLNKPSSSLQSNQGL